MILVQGGSRCQRACDAAPFLVDPEALSIRAVCVLGADELDDQVLAALRNRALEPGVPVVATGRFADHQGYLAARGRLAHAMGREPRVIDLTETQLRPLIAGAHTPLVAELAPRPRPLGPVPVVSVAPGPAELDDPLALARLSQLAHRADFGFRLIANYEQMDQIKASRHHDLPVLTFAELSPVTLAAGTDVFAAFGQGMPGERMPPDDEAAAQAAEAELRKFWNLEIIIDGGDIGLLGQAQAR
ncbi:hypothetical protein [Rhodovulum strictum]|uniref:Uncharacterized protein n=1 Tax=Rhodovulum strictum TaxID=58314 RepID=A0A844B2A0_9RHOB|nr:hypothetical protein [Rhodovulum strictum]MRH20496.1 hypothetical protein [Rhodovulum strictum]